MSFDDEGMEEDLVNESFTPKQEDDLIEIINGIVNSIKGISAKGKEAIIGYTLLLFGLGLAFKYSDGIGSGLKRIASSYGYEDMSAREKILAISNVIQTVPTLGSPLAAMVL